MQQILQSCSACCSLLLSMLFQLKTRFEEICRGTCTLQKKGNFVTNKVEGNAVH